ncbi:hypothetical protein PIB30_024450 [Stylosanthes scabra]|uniref:Aminotransferase-like plant mobile domain-containing protein n=1 Tax=Stylosanthes scabra TaxID=79078 RepID=A0ABU6W9E2_9FABA|nr:hypothetical protein [Stylosanthes scabra]
MQNLLLRLYEFETLMPDGRGRQHWDLFKEIFGVMPPPEAADPCTVTFSWLTAMFGVLFGDKTAARVLIRWIPFVDHLNDLGQYSWGSATLAWLYRNLYRGRYGSYRAGHGGFLASDRMGLITSDGPWLLDEKDPRVIMYRIKLDRPTDTL